MVIVTVTVTFICIWLLLAQNGEGTVQELSKNLLGTAIER